TFAGASNSASVYFPCRTPAGNPATGAGCAGSITPAPSPSATYKFALNATNANGTTAYTSPAITFLEPQINIAGFTGGTLNIVTGGSADATKTQGNIGSAVFDWTFTPSGTSSSQNPVVPAGSTNFSLTVIYADGYQPATVSGSINIRNLVGDFTLP